MHELFLTAHISEHDRPRALQVLQGYCAMSPTPILRRRLYWNAPLVNNRGLDLASVTAQGPRTRFWHSLNEQLVRQPYTVLLLYDVTRDQFPKPDTPTGEKPTLDCNALPGTLQWTDLPDPGSSRLVNTRLLMNIDEEKSLCNLLESSLYKFTGEVIEEGYRFVHDHVVIYLTRYLDVPSESQNMEHKKKPTVNKTLPPFESLSPFDSENKWIMTASLQVLAASDLEHIQKGTDALMNIKTDLEGCFDFQIKDRHIFDTRVKA